MTYPCNLRISHGPTGVYWYGIARTPHDPSNSPFGPTSLPSTSFDDGYADRLVETRPVLKRYACPGTVLLVTGAISERHAFWGDELSRMLFVTPLVQPQLEIEIADSVPQWQINCQPTGCTNQGVGIEAVVNCGQLHNEFWRLLRPLLPEARRQILMRLCNWAQIEVEAESIHWPLTADEARCLSGPGLIDVGAHTVTHPPLIFLSEASHVQRSQAVGLPSEEIVAKPIHGFAYQFGDFDDPTTTCVRDSGFAYTCSAQGESASQKTDQMRLRHFPVATGIPTVSPLD